MNGTWLAFFTLMLVVLIAVAAGAQQIQAQQAREISDLMAQRETTVSVALEAKEQRDAAVKARDEAVAKMNGLNDRIASLQADLQQTQTLADSRQQEIDRLVSEANTLQAQVQDLQAKNVALEAQYAKLLQEAPQIPVAGSGNASSGNPESSAGSIRLPISAGELPNQLGLGLAILIGMAALGSGGYIYYHHDPNRKVSVKMTRDQIHEYAQYQRERANRAAE